MEMTWPSSSQCKEAGVFVSRAAVPKYHKPGGLTNRNTWSHRSGGQKAKLKVWAGLVPSEGSEEGCVPGLSASRGLLTITGVPWLMGPSP